MVGATTTELKYSNELKVIDGECFKQCGACGEYFFYKLFLQIQKKRAKYSPFCKDCQEFRAAYNDNKKEVSNWVKRRIDEKKKCQ